MKKLLNTLYATTEGASLRKDGENLVATVDGSERGRVPLHMLGAVVAFGAISVSRQVELFEIVKLFVGIRAMSGPP